MMVPATCVACVEVAETPSLISTLLVSNSVCVVKTAPPSQIAILSFGMVLPLRFNPREPPVYNLLVLIVAEEIALFSVILYSGIPKSSTPCSVNTFPSLVTPNVSQPFSAARENALTRLVLSTF
ncbi:hypothetical protein D3C85_1280300 [compost metagenome]